MSSYPDLTSQEVALLDVSHCPDCGCRSFLSGPRGGCSQNIMCLTCGSKFNVVHGLKGSFGKERISGKSPGVDQEWAEIWSNRV